MKLNLLYNSKKAAIVLAAVFAFSFAGAAHAQTAPAADPCTLSASDFTKLTAIQNNPNLSAAEELSQELAYRKQLLSQTITCATEDAQTLQDKLTAVATTPGASSTESLLAGKINDALNFYVIESGKLSGAGIRATEAIAKEMAAWRVANYIPLEGQVSNFMVWSENQNLFGIAQNRFAKTEYIVGFIEAAAPNSDLTTGLNEVRSSLADATTENTAAWERACGAFTA